MLFLAYGFLTLATLIFTVATVVRVNERSRLRTMASVTPPPPVKVTVQLSERSVLVAKVPRRLVEEEGWVGLSEFLAALSPSDLEKAQRRALEARPNGASSATAASADKVHAVGAWLWAFTVAGVVAVLALVLILPDGSRLRAPFIFAALAATIVELILALADDRQSAHEELNRGLKRALRWMRQ
jgi:hypothetical protein